ncbi:DNA alkylation repair protein [Geobacillus thermocatenulatus]|uniref:DNA alkylation repair protein n=1 Tax=Geobacillus thermocatenulatus TaxID=33938 RepID=UPI003D24A9A1
MEPMLCPNCKTNRTRFHLIEQHPRAVKIDPHTGDIEHEYTNEALEPFHLPYRGPSYCVQCGVCGLIEDADMFIQRAKSSPLR